MNNRDQAQIAETARAIQEIGEGIETALIAFDRLSTIPLPYQGSYLLHYLTMAQQMITELGVLFISHAQQEIDRSADQ